MSACIVTREYLSVLQRSAFYKGIGRTRAKGGIMADNSAVVLPSLPNSIEAEQNVLCCILRNASIQLDIISELEPEDFYQTNHRIIFDAMKEIARKTHKVDNEYRSNTVSFATVVDALRRNGKLQQVGDVEYIARLN